MAELLRAVRAPVHAGDENHAHGTKRGHVLRVVPSTGRDRFPGETGSLGGVGNLVADSRNGGDRLHGGEPLEIHFDTSGVGFLGDLFSDVALSNAQPVAVNGAELSFERCPARHHVERARPCVHPPHGSHSVIGCATRDPFDRQSRGGRGHESVVAHVHGCGSGVVVAAAELSDETRNARDCCNHTDLGVVPFELRPLFNV